MKSLTVEKHYPLAAAIVSSGVSAVLDLEMKPNGPQLLAATVTFGAIASGFVGTSLSILTSLDTPVMQRIRATAYLGILKDYLCWALVSGIVLSLAGIIGLLLEDSQLPRFVPVWVLTLAFCLCCLWRLGRTMLQVFADRENARPIRR